MISMITRICRNENHSSWKEFNCVALNVVFCCCVCPSHEGLLNILKMFLNVSLHVLTSAQPGAL